MILEQRTNPATERNLHVPNTIRSGAVRNVTRWTLRVTLWNRVRLSLHKSQSLDSQ